MAQAENAFDDAVNDAQAEYDQQVADAEAYANDLEAQATGL